MVASSTLEEAITSIEGLLDMAMWRSNDTSNASEQDLLTACRHLKQEAAKGVHQDPALSLHSQSERDMIRVISATQRCTPPTAQGQARNTAAFCWDRARTLRRVDA